eukprot:TRINITY_DN2116_c0_g1_i8.p1 TRINITY_DN2116_c0_g1~~TRINITY_DN2116_c0_g1_i8.p1  ORF type:complete len:149 (-),score=23.37 TRINITY_DN2116_c0_g1_i8:633-1079(-)
MCIRDRYEVTEITTCLRLCNNSLPNLDGLNDVVEELFDHTDKISWFDFSFNQLKTIDLGLLAHTNLRSVYLQGNQITDVREVLKLRVLPHLKSLALHGNPLEESKRPPYRVFTAGAIRTLMKLDFCAITAQDREEADMWWDAYGEAYC